MKCFKCDKEMGRLDGGPIIKGIVVQVNLGEPDKTQGNFDYYNLQLGKYSDGKGGCNVAICYECYIDGLFQIRG